MYRLLVNAVSQPYNSYHAWPSADHSLAISMDNVEAFVNNDNSSTYIVPFAQLNGASQ